MNNRLQLEYMGFSIENKKNACEGLIFLTNKPDGLKGEFFLEVAGNLFSHALSYGKKKGMNIVYGTCERKLKAMYSLLGWEVIDRKKIDGINKLLLCYNLK